MGYERNDRRPGGYSGERGSYYGGQDRGYGGQDRNRGYGDYGSRDEYRSQSYGNYGGAGARDYRGERFNDDGRCDYGRDPRGYDYDRGFFERAGDEVRSWFGDEDAERRRREDERRYEAENGYRDRGSSYAGNYGNYGSFAGNDRGGERSGQQDHDPGYRSWRDRQVEAFDRDYDEYRRENQTRFDSEFATWRQGRQGKRDLLGRVQEHDEVVGSDGQHVGTVDHVRGDNLKLTKTDQAAGGHHHLIPSSWIESVEAKKVTLSKTADQAKQHWRDAERNDDGNMFGRDRDGQNQTRSFDRAFGGNNR